MKLFIIVVCMVFERYGENFERLRCFHWFYAWTRLVQASVTTASSPLLLTTVLFPILMVLWFIHYSLGAWFWGGLDLILEGLIFFYCLGPQNLFNAQPSSEAFDAELYFEKVNRQWFGVMFWYIVTGIWGAVIYRLLDLATTEPRLEGPAGRLLQYLDWIPARLTALL
jgi:AmpE protein